MAYTGARIAFKAYPSADLLDVTGDGTFYDIIFNTEAYDLGSAYNTATGVFTAPVAGVYIFQLTLSVTVPAASGTLPFQFGFKRNSTYHTCVALPTRERVTNFFSYNGDIAASAVEPYNLAAGDTIMAFLQASSGTKTTDIRGTEVFSYFSGARIV